MAIATPFDQLGNWNPQLHRELRTRLTRANAIAVAALSLLLQAALCVPLRFFLAMSEGAGPVRNYRYICATSDRSAAIASWRFPTEHLEPFCPSSDLTDATIPALNWPLWWLDLMVWLSSFGLAMLVLGSLLLLLLDLHREAQAGTLHLLRLSPQSAARVLSGKLLGVPSLLYWGLLLALPLQLWAAHQAWLGLGRILVFDAIALAAALGLQTLAVAIALSAASPQAAERAPRTIELAWLGTPLVLLTLLSLASSSKGNGLLYFNAFDALKVLNPIFFLPHVLARAPHSLATIDYLNVKDWAQLTWFGWPLWEQVAIAASLSLLAWGAIAAVGWQCSLRRYERPTAPLFSKAQSYGITATASVVLLGFTLQDGGWQSLELSLAENFGWLLAGLLLWLLLLGLALRPQRQAALERARYRHHQSPRQTLQAYLWQDDTPASLAVAVNAAIASSLFLAGLVVAPLSSLRGPLAIACLGSASLAILLAGVWQWLSFSRLPARLQGLATLLAAPIASFGALTLGLVRLPLPPASYVTALAWVLLGEGLAIALSQWLVWRQIRRLAATGSRSALPAAGKTRSLSAS